MSFGYYNQTSSNISFKADAVMPAPLAKPIEKVQKTIDEFVPEIGHKKDSHKRRNAIAVGSSVIVLSALVAVLNPKFSPKLVKKLEALSNKAKAKAEANEHDTVLNKIYKASKAASDKTLKALGFVNNFNSGKDGVFKWFCTEEKDFLSISNKSARNVLKKVDSGVRKVLKKPHEKITEWFDKIGQHTVLAKYSKAAKKMDSLEEIIKSHKSKLSDSEQKQLDTLINEIQQKREFFSKTNTQQRFQQYEDSMQNLERNFWTKYRKYKNGFKDKWRSDVDYINKNMSYWVEDIMQPAQTRFESGGNKAVYELIGDGSEQVGAYKKALQILEPHLSSEEKGLLEKQYQKTAKSLNKAKHSEFVDYFAKKRDLIMGSAPTDIVTAIFGLGMSGVAISKADTNDERISKLLTGVFPIMGGLTASMIFAAQLVSGPVGMVAGAGIGVLLNVVGSFANKHILGNRTEVEVLQDA